MIFRSIREDDIDKLMIQERQAHFMLYADDSYRKALVNSTTSCVAEHAGRIIAIVGLTPLGDGRASAWTLLSKDARHHMLSLTRRVRKFLDDFPYRRMEAQTDVGFDAAERWLEILNFEKECVMKSYTTRGDATLWARIK